MFLTGQKDDIGTLCQTSPNHRTEGTCTVDQDAHEVAYSFTFIMPGAKPRTWASTSSKSGQFSFSPGRDIGEEGGIGPGEDGPSLSIVRWWGSAEADKISSVLCSFRPAAPVREIGRLF